ncbi:hypothetical protein EJF36_08420 [Bacillus sp. HMF5848]|uniref:pyridoxamine 5'-phosphate oxidase family protein n=1 Tax=Bacillus sp. HMF5848 TaxID=2495421 RepID=UPI000F77AB59|nr:pyridoxamine 5'-phosphate oxidase family protein [Bacillus sp. HMF5848]RSK26889.1 hypothetical protein EJF36_08420 [Bacillus sp. HMF5848]
MANEVENHLIAPLFEAMQQERFVTIATIDHESKCPNVSAISWIFARDPRCLVFAVDNRSRIFQNIIYDNKVVVSIISNESCYSISGKVSLLVEEMKETPLPLAKLEIHIDEVRDVMFYGSKIIGEPNYDKTYDAEAAVTLDKQVMTALRKK